MYEADFLLPKREKDCFTSIRMILCIIIIYEHAVLLGDIDFFKLNIRNIAVDLFFCISGYWVTISLINSTNLTEYCRKRMKKILPPYFLVILLCFIFGAHFTNVGEGYWKNVDTWKYLASNIVFLNFIQPTLPGLFMDNPTGAEINGALWTMKVEVGFYIFLPLIMFALSKIKSEFKRGLFLISLYIVSFLYEAFFVYFKPQGIIASLGHQFPAYMRFFVAGIIFVLYHDWFKKREKVLIIPAILMVILYVRWDVFILSIFVPIALMIVVMYIAYHFKGNEIFKIDYSYVMYLIHYPIIQLFVFLGYFSLHPEVAIISVLIIAFFIAFAYAYLNGIIKGLRNTKEGFKIG